MCDSQALVLQHYSPMPSLSLMNCASITPYFEKKTTTTSKKNNCLLIYMFCVLMFYSKQKRSFVSWVRRRVVCDRPCIGSEFDLSMHRQSPTFYGQTGYMVQWGKNNMTVESKRNYDHIIHCYYQCFVTCVNGKNNSYVGEILPNFSRKGGK